MDNLQFTVNSLDTVGMFVIISSHVSSVAPCLRPGGVRVLCRLH